MASEIPPEMATSPSARHGRLRGAAALRLHVTLFFSLAFCALAFFFELHRAQSGNELSWAYVFEWPLLGGFGIYMWWNVLHDGHIPRKKPRREKPIVEPQYEGMLAAWQEHQRNLAVNQEADRQRLESKDTP